MHRGGFGQPGVGRPGFAQPGFPMHGGHHVPPPMMGGAQPGGAVNPAELNNMRHQIGMAQAAAGEARRGVTDVRELVEALQAQLAGLAATVAQQGRVVARLCTLTNTTVEAVEAQLADEDARRTAAEERAAAEAAAAAEAEAEAEA
jgi:hypothetical protein